MEKNSSEETLCVIKDVEEAKLFQNFKTIFSCSICLNYIIEPRMTPCGHMFCSECLQNWIQSVYPQTRCPCCRESFRLDDTLLLYNGQSTKSTVKLKGAVKKKLSFKSNVFHGHRFCGILLYEMEFEESLSLISVILISILCTGLLYLIVPLLV